MKKNNPHLLFIIVAAVSWGCIGLATRPLGALGLSSMQTTVVRLICTTLLMALLLLMRDRALFQIDIRKLPLFMLAGANFFGLTFFYLSAIRENNSASVAAMLLYTNPVWLTIFSRILFKEKITPVKIAALTGAMGGCALLLLTQEVSISLAGLIFGLLSGVSQALYSVFGKLLSKDNQAETNTFYTFLFATVVSLFFISPQEIHTVLGAQPLKCTALFAVLVIGMTIMPYTVYIAGLKKVPVGTAGIICILEPVVASIAGFLAFQDPINQWGVLGIVIVVLSLVLIEFDRKERTTAPADS